MYNIFFRFNSTHDASPYFAICNPSLRKTMAKSNLFWNKFQCTTDKEIKRYSDKLVHPPAPYTPMLYSSFPNRDHITTVMMSKHSTPVAIYSKTQLIDLFKDDDKKDLVKELMAMSITNSNPFSGKDVPRK